MSKCDNESDTIKVLPLVYDEALSYYESICKLYESFNKLVEDIDNQLKGFTDTANAYTDKKVSDLRIQLKAEIQAVRLQFNTLKATTEAQLALFDSEIKDFEKRTNIKITSSNAQLRNEIKQSEQRVYDYISDNLQNQIKVLDPFTGNMVTIQYMLDYLSNFHSNSATYAAMRDSAKTYSQLSALNKTYTEWYMSGKTFL